MVLLWLRQSREYKKNVLYKYVFYTMIKQTIMLQQYDRYPTCQRYSLRDRYKEFPVRLSVKEMRIVDPDNDPYNETRAW